MEGEITLTKTCGGVFNGTNIEYVLRNLGVQNLIIVGGLLQIVHFGAGAVSLDNRRKTPTLSNIDRYQSLGANT